MVRGLGISRQVSSGTGIFGVSPGVADSDLREPYFESHGQEGLNSGDLLDIPITSIPMRL